MKTFFLDALAGVNTNRPPLWLMRQAGRYLPEYRELRAKHDFLTLCKTPELIREVTLQPIKRFDFDAAILFSDILMIPDAMGLGLSFEESKGPIFAKKISSKEDVENLKPPEMLSFVMEGIKLIKQDLDRPLIGFAGAPFTVASYMIEGGSSPDFKKTRKWMESDPITFHLLLSKIADATIDYLKAQIEAGVDALQLFDSWACYLNPAQFQEFSNFYLQKIKKELPVSTPLIFFCKGLQDYTGFEDVALSVDSSVSLPMLRQSLGSKVTLQGNIDPDLLLGPKDHLICHTKELLNSMQNDPAWIFNLGHGIKPETPLENVYALRDTIFNS